MNTLRKVLLFDECPYWEGKLRSMIDGKMAIVLITPLTIGRQLGSIDISQFDAVVVDASFPYATRIISKIRADFVGPIIVNFSDGFVHRELTEASCSYYCVGNELPGVLMGLLGFSV